MTATEWLPNGYVERSVLDPSVWVPFLPDSDDQHYLHAGSLRRVKRYVERVVPDPGERYRWVHESPDVWAFQTTGDRP